jgi:hypothetical protein
METPLLTVAIEFRAVAPLDRSSDTFMTSDDPFITKASR